MREKEGRIEMDRRAAALSQSSSRLPDGDSKIFRLYLFGTLGLRDYGSATLPCKIKFCYMATLVTVGTEQR